MFKKCTWYPSYYQAFHDNLKSENPLFKVVKYQVSKQSEISFSYMHMYYTCHVPVYVKYVYV